MSRFYGDGEFVPPKYWFYRDFMRFTHKFGWHYAPREYPIDEPHTTKNKLGEVKHWRHWCQWCGLRGETIEVAASPTQTVKENKTV